MTLSWQSKEHCLASVYDACLLLAYVYYHTDLLDNLCDDPYPLNLHLPRLNPPQIQTLMFICSPIKDLGRVGFY